MIGKDELLDELYHQGTMRLVLLSILTLGIYMAHYIKRQSAVLNRYAVDQGAVPEWFVNALLFLAYFTVVLIIPYMIVEEGHPLERISDLLDAIFSIGCVIWGFFARKRMNGLLRSSRNDGRWFSGFWTFIFSAFYFNYKVNALRESASGNLIA